MNHMAYEGHQFVPFLRLPAEIRLTIWELVKPPTRLIGQVPCRECWKECVQWSRGRDASCEPRRQCERANHADWRVRYIVHPRSQVIFPLLHTCRESRGAWLPRFHRPGRRHVRCETGVRCPDEGDVSVAVRFDVPFIHYDSDVMTMFDDWAYTGVLNTVDHRPQTEQSVLDPFIGLRRDEIRHAAFCESSQELWSGLLGLDLRSLPKLASLSLVRMGPLPRSMSMEEWGDLSSPTEMSPAQSQYLDCAIVRSVTQPAEDSCQAFFHHWRPRDQLFEPRSELQSFALFHRFWTAFLWHLLHRDARRCFDRDYSGWWAFMEYAGLSGHDAAESVCVLSRAEGCGVGGHSHGDMFSWKAGFRLRCLLLCEVGRLEDLGALENANGDTVSGRKGGWVLLPRA